MIRNPYRNYVCNVNLMCIFLMFQKTISNRIRSHIPNTKLLHNKPKKDWNKHNIHVLIVSRKMIINDNNKRNYSRNKSEPRFHSHFWVVLIFLFFFLIRFFCFSHSIFVYLIFSPSIEFFIIDLYTDYQSNFLSVSICLRVCRISEYCFFLASSVRWI